MDMCGHDIKHTVVAALEAPLLANLGVHLLSCPESRLC